MKNKENDTPEFIEEANQFYFRYKDAFVFRLVKFILGCDDFQLGFVIKTIFVRSIDGFENIKDSFYTSLFGLAALPFYMLIKKKWIWKKEKRASYNFDTVDSDYFYGRYYEIYKSLNGTKRITPRNNDFEDREDITESAGASICFTSLIQIFIFSPIIWIALIIFSIRSRLNIMGVYRYTIHNYLIWQGYFTRYPCNYFITYEDDTNNPSRYIAFKQNSNDGLLMVIQNGERIYSRRWAFGMVDIYFTFGKTFEDLIKKMRIYVDKIIPVGSLALNKEYNLFCSFKDKQKYDILYIDNGSLSHPSTSGWFNENFRKSEEIIFDFLSQYKLKNKKCRIGYQLRIYENDSIQKKFVIETLQKYFSDNIEIIENTGKGESYQNILRSELILTFFSTMGFEALMMGKKALFINYTDQKQISICADNRFLLEEIIPKYETFEKKINQLMSIKLDSVPKVALDRYYSFDGKVQSRISKAIHQLCKN